VDGREGREMGMLAEGEVGGKGRGKTKIKNYEL